MAKTVATLIGVVFILVGAVGFASHDLLGAHLGTVHNVVHLVSGVVSLFIGLKGSLSAARMFCIVFGLVYAGLGVVGYVAGTGEEKMLELPGPLTLGTVDHIIHIAIGVLYLAGGLMTKAGSVQTASGD
ncbi:MAG TPA: DUF4383 domain-containing protein [Blastocatellia bacterium]|jgi:hypothetical protein